MGGLLIFLAAVSLHGFVRRMQISYVMRALFMALALALIYPDRMAQAACAAAGLALFAVLYRLARRREGSSELAAA